MEPLCEHPGCQEPAEYTCEECERGFCCLHLGNVIDAGWTCDACATQEEPCHASP